MLFTLLKTIILGIVEGVTEWLPVSSTGHLILVGNLLELGQSESFTEMFNVVIQLGAILAVVVIYFWRLWPFHTAGNAPEETQFSYRAEGGFTRKFQNFADKYLYMDKIVLWLKIAVALIPAVIVGALFDDWLEAHLYKPVPVAVMLILYGVLFIVIENWNRGRKSRISRIRQISWKNAFLVGCFQALAVIPGTSRSGATIVGGLLLGMSRTVAAEFTFFLAIPTMFGASVLKLAKFGLHFTAAEAVILLTGMVVSFVVSIFVIRFLMGYIRKHDFKVFGWYRIVLGAIVILLGIAGVI